MKISRHATKGSADDSGTAVPRPDFKCSVHLWIFRDSSALKVRELDATLVTENGRLDGALPLRRHLSRPRSFQDSYI